MGCTVEELGERMTSAEFSLHLAYWRKEPTGPSGEMFKWAALMAAVLNGPLTRRDKRLFKASDIWDGEQWKPPPVAAPAKPGAKKARMAPDFSHVRGMRVNNKPKPTG